MANKFQSVFWIPFVWMYTPTCMWWTYCIHPISSLA